MTDIVPSTDTSASGAQLVLGLLKIAQPTATYNVPSEWTFGNPVALNGTDAIVGLITNSDGTKTPKVCNTRVYLMPVNNTNVYSPVVIYYDRIHANVFSALQLDASTIQAGNLQSVLDQLNTRLNYNVQASDIASWSITPTSDPAKSTVSLTFTPNNLKFYSTTEVSANNYAALISGTQQSGGALPYTPIEDALRVGDLYKTARVVSDTRFLPADGSFVPAAQYPALEGILPRTSLKRTAEPLDGNFNAVFAYLKQADGSYIVVGDTVGSTGTSFVLKASATADGISFTQLGTSSNVDYVGYALNIEGIHQENGYIYVTVMTATFGKKAYRFNIQTSSWEDVAGTYSPSYQRDYLVYGYGYYWRIFCDTSATPNTYTLQKTTNLEGGWTNVDTSATIPDGLTGGMSLYTFNNYILLMNQDTSYSVSGVYFILNDSGLTKVDVSASLGFPYEFSITGDGFLRINGSIISTNDANIEYNYSPNIENNLYIYTEDFVTWKSAPYGFVYKLAGRIVCGTSYYSDDGGATWKEIIDPNSVLVGVTAAQMEFADKGYSIFGGRGLDSGDKLTFDDSRYILPAENDWMQNGPGAVPLRPYIKVKSAI